MSTIRIENNTVRPIGLPPTDSFPRGVTLQPGLNNVPSLFWDEYTTYEVTNEKGKTFCPGKLALDRYTQPVDIWTPDGLRRGPMLTVYPEGAAVDSSGPPAPLRLPTDTKAAEKLVEVTTDRAALERWAKEKRRDEVSAKAQAKLAELKG